ncbi:MAG: ABC transporter substrate-binding protein, partial [Pseudomonadota bacterium]
FEYPNVGGEQPADVETYRELGLPAPQAEEAAAVEIPLTGELLRVGFLPIAPSAQLFLMVENGWSRPLGFTIAPRQFVTAESMADAMADGDVHIGILDGGHVLAAWERGKPLQIVAAAAIDAVGLYATGPTADLLESGDPADAIRKHIEAGGNRLTIASIDAESSASAALNIWAFDTLRLTADELRTPSGDLLPVWRALLRGRLRAVIAPEPIIASLQAQNPLGRVVADGARLLTGQPTAVVAVTEESIRIRRDRIKDYLRLHRRATNALRDDPTVAAEATARFAGFNRLRAPEMAVALRARYSRFADDPGLLVEPMAVMASYLRREGLLFQDAPPHDVINDALFREIEAEDPGETEPAAGPASAPPLPLAPG